MDSGPEITNDHLAYCFNTIINSLKKDTTIRLPYPKHLNDYKLPLFITWEFSKDSSLRGCIGSPPKITNF